MSGALLTARFPDASITSSESTYRPSGTARPAASRPVQARVPEVPLSDHLRIRVLPRRIRSEPVPASLAVHASLALSVIPSPSGLNVGGVAVRLSTGGVESTSTVQVLVAAFPAASRAPSVRLYEPSATTDPSSARPFHAAVTVAPAPTCVRTAGPPAAGVATSDQPTASAEPMPVAVTVSFRPSPFGDRRVPLSTGRLRVGGAVSTVMPTAARTPGVTGLADGHVTGAPAAVPESWRM